MDILQLFIFVAFTAWMFAVGLHKWLNTDVTQTNVTQWVGGIAIAAIVGSFMLVITSSLVISKNIDHYQRECKSAVVIDDKHNMVCINDYKKDN